MKKNKKEVCRSFVFYYSLVSSGCPLPLSANVTTANAIATPTADPNAAIPASAIENFAKR